jgi:uncharacterized glyoxalase superfamily protein PhnB
MSGVLDLKAFVPSKDFEESKSFYAELGFQCNWETEQLAEMQIGDYRFLLQNFFDEQHADNFMIQLLVSDADEWWQRVCDSNVTETYERARASAPELQPWGQRVLYLWDPSGVLWHIAVPAEQDA